MAAFEHRTIVPLYHRTPVSFSLFDLGSSSSSPFSLPLSFFHSLCLAHLFSVSFTCKSIISFWLFLFGKKSKRQSPFGLFESCREKRISLCFMRRLRKLVHFWGRTRLRMKLIAKKELILLFQMTPSRILCDR